METNKSGKILLGNKLPDEPIPNTVELLYDEEVDSFEISAVDSTGTRITHNPHVVTLHYYGNTYRPKPERIVKIVTDETHLGFYDDISPIFFMGSTIIIPEGVISTGTDAFSYLSAVGVVFPESLQSIGEMSFMDNRLTEVIFNEGLQSIGPEAFRYNQLTEVIFNEGLQSIGARAFEDNQLTEVTLGPNTTYTSDSFDTGVIVNGGILI